ncbi:MAG: BPSS1780 family membrane protein [Pseudomonadota bacterium]
MSEARYRVTFSGRTTGSGEANVNAVKQAMVEKFKLPAAQVEKLFSGSRAVIKKDLDEASAEKFRRAFEQIGAVVEIESMEPASGLSLEPTDAPASAPPRATPDLGTSSPEPPPAQPPAAPPPTAATPRAAPDLGGVAPGPAPQPEADPYAPPATADLLVDEYGDDETQVHAPRMVGFGRGWSWIADAARLFGKAPGVWIGIVVIGFVVLFICGLIPLLNIIIPYLLMPVMAGGVMLGAHRLAHGGELEINDLFAGFRDKVGTLLMIGVLYFVFTLLIMGTVFAIILGTSGYMGMLSGDEEAVMQMAENWQPFLIAILLGTALILPVVAMTWFSPALVMIHDVPLKRALGWSIAGCFKNFLPFLLYGILMTIMFFVGILPVFLGLLVVGPILAASLYTSYYDIYVDE